MKYFVLVVVTVALVGGVSAAPLVKKSLNEAGAEDKLLELLMRYLNAQTAAEADDTAAVLEEEREENEQIDQVVEKEDGGIEEALFKVAQLQKKNEEYDQLEKKDEETDLLQKKDEENDQLEKKNEENDQLEKKMKKPICSRRRMTKTISSRRKMKEMIRRNSKIIWNRN
ncbi:uncharacterized protein [Amphiura filiformis]|uniref:uncharacterized protein isoform X2 n=1 Tax=Amphiura filiformis TaxID=82378 RepID=UPI003B20CDC0